MALQPTSSPVSSTYSFMLMFCSGLIPGDRGRGMVQSPSVSQLTTSQNSVRVELAFQPFLSFACDTCSTATHGTDNPYTTSNGLAHCHNTSKHRSGYGEVLDVSPPSAAPRGLCSRTPPERVRSGTRTPVHPRPGYIRYACMYGPVRGRAI